MSYSVEEWVEEISRPAILRFERRTAPIEHKRGVFTKRINKQNGEQKNLNLNLTIHEGITLIVGDNGCGKTSLIKAIDPVGNRGNFEGILHYYNEMEEEMNLNADFGRICHRFLAVYPKLEDNPWHGGWKVSLILEILDRADVEYDKEWFYALMKEFHLDTNKMLKEYSSGEQSLICLLLALVRRPDVLLLDEPGVFLSLINRPKLYKILKNYCHMEDHRSIVVTSNHPMEEIAAFGSDLDLVVMAGMDVIDSLWFTDCKEMYPDKNIEKVVAEMLEGSCYIDA